MQATSCFSLQPWVPYLLVAAMCGGMVIGMTLRFVLDYAELESYRRLARRNHPNQ